MSFSLDEPAGASSARLLRNVRVRGAGDRPVGAYIRAASATTMSNALSPGLRVNFAARYPKISAVTFR